MLGKENWGGDVEKDISTTYAWTQRIMWRTTLLCWATEQQGRRDIEKIKAGMKQRCWLEDSACCTKYRVKPLSQREQSFQPWRESATDVYSLTYKLILWNEAAYTLKIKKIHIKSRILAFFELSEYHPQLAHIAMTVSIWAVIPIKQGFLLSNLSVSILCASLIKL